jgi:chemotaxis protein methyltransferase CheR
VLIYFDQPTKTAVLDRIADMTERDGFLVLGGAETVVGLTSRFRLIADKRGLYVQPENTAFSSNVLSFSLPEAAAAGSRG